VETLGFPQLDAHRDQIGFGSEVVPDGEAMGKALGASTVAAYADGTGFTLRSHGTLGFGSVLAGLGAGLDEVLKRAAINGAHQRSAPRR
jgi:hypothetical protein